MIKTFNAIPNPKEDPRYIFRASDGSGRFLSFSGNTAKTWPGADKESRTTWTLTKNGNLLNNYG